MRDDDDDDMPELISRQAVVAGTQPWGPVQVPLGATVAIFTVSRADVRTLTGRLDWTLDVSYDNGQTWDSLGGAGHEFVGCGQSSGDFSIPTYGRASGSWREIAEPANGRRLLRGTVTTRETTTLAVTVDFR